MFNLEEMIRNEIQNGYTDFNARAKVCQDIVLKSIASGKLNKKITVKGGVVMRSKSNNIRRATQDLDLDFIRYSLSDESIDVFVEKLRSLLKLGPISTRFKDVFDMFFLSKRIELAKLKLCLDAYIFSDKEMHEYSVSDVIGRVQQIFSNEMYMKSLLRSNKNWLNESVAEVTTGLTKFLKLL